MAKDKEGHKKTEEQQVANDEGFMPGEGYPNCEGEPCANMADGDDSESGGETSAADEAALWKDKYMRLSAEYENYRKRTLREKLELIDSGGEDVVKSMLEVLDDMDRALVALEKTEEIESAKQGLALIANKLGDTLRSRGLSEVMCVGEELDTDLHEAVAKIDVGEKELQGRIVDVIQKGYKLKDKIIRYAKVVVGQ